MPQKLGNLLLIILGEFPFPMNTRKTMNVGKNYTYKLTQSRWGAI